MRKSIAKQTNKTRLIRQYWWRPMGGNRMVVLTGSCRSKPIKPHNLVQTQNQPVVSVVNSEMITSIITDKRSR